ncbi:MAG: DUF2059 domain-containing protein [Treponema sp.]|nr:DUF2059 domain-containing protein [Treponema sp.]
MMKKYLLILLFCAAAVSGFGQSKEKEAEIIRLLELTNVKNLAEQVFDLYIPQLQTLVPSVPQEFWDLFKAQMDFDDFIKAYIPLYDRYYTLEEIRAMIVFYESPAGKKVIEVTPLMTAESMSIGQEWGLKMGQKLLEEMKQSGYLDA